MAVGDATVNLTGINSTDKYTSFDGVDDYVEAPINPLGACGNNDWSLNVWVLDEGQSTTKYALTLGKDIVGAYDEMATITVNSDGVLRSQCYNDGFDVIVIDGTLTVGVWNMLTLVRDGNTMRPYLNSVAQTTGDLTDIIYSNKFGDGVLTIGNTTHDNKNACFNGNIKTAGVWNKKITQSEIDDLYAGTDVADYKVAGYTLQDAEYKDTVQSNDAVGIGCRLVLRDPNLAEVISDARTTANDKILTAHTPKAQILSVAIEEAA